MRRKKLNPQPIKRISRPAITHCLSCQTRLRRCLTISQRTVVTLQQVVQVIHCGYRCPNSTCPDHQRLDRSSQADELALPGFPFGLDILLLVGHLRLSEHKTVDEVHRLLMQRSLAPCSKHFASGNPLAL